MSQVLFNTIMIKLFKNKKLDQFVYRNNTDLIAIAGKPTI